MKKKTKRTNRSKWGSLRKENRSEYNTWQAMMQRCYLKTCHAYKNYGARGIYVCDRWHDFRNFFEDMGKRPKGKSIDRINNNDGYKPENCRWATCKEQCNNYRNNLILEYAGEKRNLTEWANLFSLRPDTLKRRLKSGWSLELALKTKTLSNRWDSPIPRKFRKCDKPMTLNGQTKTISDWAKAYGKTPRMVYQRMQYGWGFIEALTTEKLKQKDR